MSKISRAELKNINLIELTPIRIHSHEYRSDGNIDVLVPRFKNQIFTNLVPQSKSKYINANLDEIGSAVWELIDGQKTVYQIAQILEEQFKEKIAPVYDRLALFIQQLNTNNFIYFKELKEK